MPVLAQINSFFRGLFRKPRAERDLDDEIHSYLGLLTEQKISEGMDPHDARRAARIQLGGVEQVKERVRAARSGAWFESLLQDVRFGARLLRKSPGFTAVAVLTLALGIGANTAIFSVVQGVLLAPLPYSQPDRLVMVWQTNVFPRVAISYPNFLDWRRGTRSFAQIAASARREYNLTSPGTSEHLEGEEISASFFSTLGVKLASGRDLSPAEDIHGGVSAVIISDRLWRNRFGGSPDALGKSVTLDGVDYTIIGVTSPEFRFQGDADIYTPLAQDAPVELNERAGHWIGCIARLKPGVSIAQAQAEMSALQHSLDQLYPDADRDLGAVVVSLKEQIVGDAAGTILLLLGAVAMVLLIACANVANLLLARSAARSHEFGVRSALGANRARVVRQLLTESALLSLAGGLGGLAVAKWGLKAILAMVPGNLPRSENIRLNAAVLFFAFAVSVAVGILFGLAPALKTSRLDLQAALKEGDRGATNAHHRAQSSLVVVQVALTLVLLAGGGLLLRTIRHLLEVNPGFETQHVIAFKVGVSPSLTKTAASARFAYEQLIERIRRIPGVQGADFTDDVPLTRQGGTMPFWIGSQPPASLQQAPRLVAFLAGPDYLRTMGIPLLRGRFFTLEDTVNSPCVVAIDSVFTRMYFQESDPIGQTITFGFVPVGPCRIVGVVAHVRDWGLSDPVTSVQNQIYFPLYQDPDSWVPINYPDLTVMVRTPVEAASIMPAFKAAVYEAGSDQPIYDFKTMQQIISNSMSQQRFPMILLGAFAALALLLAGVGTYGVISYSVAQRTHEIGIRMALGAQKRKLFRTVVGQGLRLALVGVAIGMAAALMLTRLLPSFSNLLYGVGTNDPLTFMIVPLVLTSATVLACYIPARRAAKVDPMIALRHE